MISRTAPTTLAKEAQIGIVGAGASGLAAAHYLAEAGYEHVILFERRQRAGGKCESITVDGRVYEMGAVLGATNYTLIRALTARVGLGEGRCAPSHWYTPSGQQAPLFDRRRLPLLLWQLGAKYPWLTTIKYRSAGQPGLSGAHPQLHENFQSFADHHGLGELPALFQPITTGFGYGYAEQVPAAYMLKYLCVSMVLACARGQGLFVWPEGIQTLWERLAYEHDVQLGAVVKRVTRADRVIVETSARRFELDYLILASPLDRALGFLDATAAERDLFSRIRTYDYWVLLCDIEGLPRDTGFIRANFAAENQGHLMIWYCRWPDADLYTLYVMGDFQTSEDVIEATCAADLRQMGARLQRVHAVRRWRYFPHVDTADMAAGFYEKLEALQGERRTFYCGEIMSFSTLECCTRYARQLVERFFAGDEAEHAPVVRFPKPTSRSTSF